MDICEYWTLDGTDRHKVPVAVMKFLRILPGCK